MASPDKNWYETGKRFINPYNFVSQTDEVDRDIPEKGNLTGKINCTITVKTPLCIPDAEKKFPDTDFIGTNEYNSKIRNRRSMLEETRFLYSSNVRVQ